ncbi:MAG: hypothetical protein R2851_14090 [Caldilineaceae bacterium]
MDWIRFAGTAGQQYVIATANLGPATDTVIQLYDADGNWLRSSDDDGEGWPPASSSCPLRMGRSTAHRRL